jgi:acyl-CoA thioesterase
VVAEATGRASAEIAPEIGGFGAGAHGGYLAAIALRAMSAELDLADRPPRSLTIHLLAAAEPGRVELQTRVERAGSTITSMTARIDRGGLPVAVALASFGRSRPSRVHHAVGKPNVPGPEDCAPLGDKPAPEVAAGLLVEHRPAAPPLPLSGGDRAELSVWMRLVEDRDVDALSTTMLADAAPPALYGLLDTFVAMPSTELTIHYADLAAARSSPWLLGVVRGHRAAAGYAVEDGELWTPGGELVLQSRQQRRVLG